MDVQLEESSSEASEDSLRVLPCVHDTRNDNAACFDGVEDTVREMRNEQPAVAAMEASSALREKAKLLKGRLQMAEEHCPTTFLIILVVFERTLHIKVCREKEDYSLMQHPWHHREDAPSLPPTL